MPTSFPLLLITGLGETQGTQRGKNTQVFLGFISRLWQTAVQGRGGKTRGPGRSQLQPATFPPEPLISRRACVQFIVVVGGRWVKTKVLIRLFGLQGKGDWTPPHACSPLIPCPLEKTHLELVSSETRRGTGGLGPGLCGGWGGGGGGARPTLPRTHII